jgi:hypothetical protein
MLKTDSQSNTPEMAADEKNSSSADKPFFKNLGASCVLIAVLMFALIDCGLKTASSLDSHIWPVTPYQTDHRSWVWWNVRDFHNTKQAPDVVLMGSSLMMAAFHGADAATLNVAQNAAFHHTCVLFERLLKVRFGKDYKSFVFALGGEMASDAYAITDSLLKGDKKPGAIIYGIAPRDFMDHSLNSAASTEIFKYMSRLGDLSPVAQESRGSLWEMGEYYLARLSFIYDHRPDFIYVQHRLSNEMARKFCGYKEMDLKQAPIEIRKQAFTELPEDNAPNELMICPPSKSDEIFHDNSDEYVYRYKKVSQKQFKGQLQYLERMLKTAQERNIKVILINMPLTELNVSLMPTGFYADYLSKVQTLAKKDNALMLDMNNPKIFPKRYFSDTVHLNVPGGKHFIEVLTDMLKRDPATSAAIESIKN